MLCTIKIFLIVLICSCLTTAEDLYYNIGENERLSIQSAVFHAYENAWSVSFLVPTTYSVLVFALCREPCPAVTSEYQVFDCKAMLNVLKMPPWYNQYLNSISSTADEESLCNNIKSAPATTQIALDKIITDNKGGALVRLRHPKTLVIFYEEEIIQSWMTVTNGKYGLSFRATQVEILGEHFGLRHFKDHVLLMNVTDNNKLLRGSMIFALRNVCTELGYSAPEFANVHSVVEGGRLRCVWECRADMLRQPYNSAPPTVQQVNTSSVEYALLEVKYACVKLPDSYSAVVFGFSIETSLMPSDIGYEQALYDAIDLLSTKVKSDLAAANLDGTIIFSIKNSVYHKSFSELLSQQQLAACALADAAKDACQEAIQTKENANYIYRRRLLSEISLPSSSVLIEGIFIANNKNILTSTEQLVLLRASLIDSIQEYAADIGTVQNIENFDFSEITTFTIPRPPIKTTPSPVPDATNTEENQVVFLLLLIGLFFASFAFLAIYCVSKV